MTITCTMVLEGSSDRCIERLVSLLHAEIAFDFRNPNSYPPGLKLLQKVEFAKSRYDSQLLLVHRDADSFPPSDRFDEIRAACADCVPVVPVRKLEAWLLADKPAILKLTGLERLPISANYPNNVEEVDAKARLEKVLWSCRQEQHWKRRHFNFPEERANLGLNIGPSSLQQLRALKSFRKFEEDLNVAITHLRS